MQPEELYGKGVSGAAEVEDQSRQSAVTGYDPAKTANVDEEKPDKK